MGGPSLDWAGKFAANRLFPRLQATEKNHNGDFMDAFIELKSEYPDTVNDNTIIGYMLINILAGSDTTSITLRAIIYYLLKTPEAYEKTVKSSRKPDYHSQYNMGIQKSCLTSTQWCEKQ